MELTYDLAILILHIPKELKARSQRGILIPIFIAALFTMDKR